MTNVGDLFTAAAAIGAVLAASVSYLALYRSSKPQLLIYYRPNPNAQTIIDLVIENIGQGSAINITFSVDIPVGCYGFNSLSWHGKYISKKGFPMLTPGQKYIFDGGQFGGIREKLNDSLTVRASYQYRNPIGCISEESEVFVLSVEHLRGLSNRKSAEQAITDALISQNKTTLHEVRDELRKLNASLSKIADKKSI